MPLKYNELSLPSPLVKKDGTRISTKQEWENGQRDYVAELMKQYMYGPIPPAPTEMTWEVLQTKTVYNGLGTREIIRLTCKGTTDEVMHLDLLVYIPAGDGPFPCTVGLNFCGNHGVEEDETIPMPDYVWPEGRQFMKRGEQNARWIQDYILSRGMALVTTCYHQIYPDHAFDGLKDSIYKLFYSQEKLFLAQPGKYSAISAWAWGLQRIADYLETRKEIDSSKLMVTDHSRLGKTALWAGANDPRFTVVVSNDSGCGGAAITRRADIGETLEVMNHYFPHWLTPMAKVIQDNVEDLPVDQHFLTSLIAPRAVAVASATEDTWADPEGEFYGLVAANEVYALYGEKEMSADYVPQGGEAVTSQSRHYHIRIGGHNILHFDWEHYIDFAFSVWRGNFKTFEITSGTNNHPSF